MTRIASVCCVASLFVWLGSAKAAPITFQFSGSVTQVPLDEVFGDIAFGDPIQGSFSFDTAAPDGIPADPTTGSYTFSAPFGMTVTVGTHDFTASGSLNIGILNAFVDQYTVLATSAAGDLTLELFLQDNTGSAFNSDQLPSALPLADFTQKDFHLDLTSALGEVQVDGQLASPASQAVPEPSVAILLLTGAAILLVSRRRKLFLQLK